MHNDSLNSDDDQNRWVFLEEVFLGELLELSSLKTLNALRVSIDFKDIHELKRSLETLSQILKHYSLSLCLLQIKYTLTTLTSQAREIHEAFAKAHEEVSTYFPLCLPPSPLGLQVRWATPESCEQCLFFEAQRCGGLTGKERRDSLSESDRFAGGALRAEWPKSFTRDDIMTDPPVCYWWPSPLIMTQVQEILSAHQIKSLWDIGGSNGFLSWLFKRSCKSLQEVFNIDPVCKIYPQSEGVISLSITAEAALNQMKEGALRTPDSLFISWPTTGRSYRELISAIEPKVIVRATDDEGVCGVRRGHRALEMSGHRGRVFTLSESSQTLSYDDLDAPDGYQIVLNESIWGYRDFNRECSVPSGRLVIFARVSG